MGADRSWKPNDNGGLNQRSTTHETLNLITNYNILCWPCSTCSPSSRFQLSKSSRHQYTDQQSLTVKGLFLREASDELLHQINRSAQQSSVAVCDRSGTEPGNTQELGIQQYRQLLICYEPIKVMVQIRHWGNSTPCLCQQAWNCLKTSANKSQTTYL